MVMIMLLVTIAVAAKGMAVGGQSFIIFVFNASTTPPMSLSLIVHIVVCCCTFLSIIQPQFAFACLAHKFNLSHRG